MRSDDAWQIVVEHAPRDEWLTTRDLYALVERHAQLVDAGVDGRGEADWRHGLRNALHRHKVRGDVDHDREKGYRFPSSNPS